MIRLTKAVNAWGNPDFNGVLKAEIEQLGADRLPLQQGLAISSYALDDKLTATIISVSEEAGFIRAKAGLFYTGIIAGCSCADDPTPVDENIEYCEVQIEINKTTAETRVVLLTGC
jgi:hypothetical protein